MIRNAVGDWGGGCQLSRKKALRRCTVQRYYRYEGVGGGQIPRKKVYVTFKWPLSFMVRVIKLKTGSFILQLNNCEATFEI